MVATVSYLGKLYVARSFGYEELHKAGDCTANSGAGATTLGITNHGIIRPGRHVSQGVANLKYMHLIYL